MANFKSNSSGISTEFLSLSNGSIKTPVSERELLLEKEMARKNRDMETLHRIYNSVSIELLDTNKAVALLARKYEKISQDKELEIAGQIEDKILSSLIALKALYNNPENLEFEIEILTSQVKSMVRQLTYGADSFNQLTPTEMRVAVLIKNGATSQQIADRLFVSESTVKTHRKNIRNKLNLQNKKLNMVEYLNRIL